jgi:hypothetical protein
MSYAKQTFLPCHCGLDPQSPNPIGEAPNSVKEVNNSDCLPVIAGLTRNPLNSTLRLCRGSRVKRGMTRGERDCGIKLAMTRGESVI